MRRSIRALWDFAIAKLGQLIELVVTIRTAWIVERDAREVAVRCLGPINLSRVLTLMRSAADAEISCALCAKKVAR